MNVSVFCTVALVIAITISICSVAACAALAVIRARRKNARKGGIAPLHIALVGFFIAVFITFLPIYYCYYFGSDGVFKTILITLHQTIRLFVVDCDFDLVNEFSAAYALSAPLKTAYSVYASILYIIAPLLTAGVVLSFFKGIKNRISYDVHFNNKVYLLSALTDKSLALAEDIRANDGRCLIAFGNVFEEDGENSQLMERAKRLGALFLNRDVTDFSLKPNRRRVERNIYLIAEDEDENLSDGLQIIEKCKRDERLNTALTRIYVFSTNVESEMLLNTVDNGDIQVRRINEKHNLILRTVDENPPFENAYQTAEGEKLISVALVGMGGYGTEFLKTMLWCAQMDGYKLCVHIFDQTEDIFGKIAYECPEIIKYNKVRTEGEPYYELYPHGGTDVRDVKFLNGLSEIPVITMAFVTLGDDKTNLETAIKMRTLFARKELELGKAYPKPKLFAVVYSDTKTEAVSKYGIKNVKNVDYDVTLIGDTRSRYCRKNVELSEYEGMGLECHLQWVDKNDEAAREQAVKSYNRFEYYRRSSIARALHLKMRAALGIVENRTNAEQCKILEHKRWSAFMRSEGYIGAQGVKDDLARVHCDLVPYDMLSEHAKSKDSVKLINQRKN